MHLNLNGKRRYRELVMHVPSLKVKNMFALKVNSKQGNASNTLGNEYHPCRTLPTAAFTMVFFIILITMQLAIDNRVIAFGLSAFA